MKKIFTLLSLVLLTCSAAWAGTTTKMWNFSEIEIPEGQDALTIETITEYDGLTMHPTVTIDKNNKTIEDVKYTQRFKFGGKTSVAKDGTLSRFLQFDVVGPTVVELAIASSNKKDTPTISLYVNNPSSEAVSTTTAQIGDPNIETLKYTGTEPATLFIGTTGGANMHFMRITTTVDDAPALPTVTTLAEACAMDVEEQHYIMGCDLEVVDYVEMLNSYVVTDGTSHAVVMLGAECTPGDVISQGWEAYNDVSGLFIVTIDDVTVTEGEPVNTLAVYAYGEHADAAAHHKYAKITGVPVTFTDEEADALEDLFIQDTMGILAEGDGLYDIAGMWIEVPGVAPFDEEDPEVTPAVCLFIPMSATKTADTYTVYFNNNSTNWSDVYAYAWDSETDKNLGAWPGTKLETVNDGVYTYTFTSAFEPSNIIFNNNAGAQTANLTFENGKTYIFEDALYLRGGWDSSWAATDDWKFETEDNVVYTLTTPAEIAKDTQFKVAHADWSKANWGGAGVEPNTTVTLKSGDNAWAAATIPAGAKVSFNATKGEITFSVTTAIDSIDADAANAVYYNLQGVKVENPAKGKLYIRVAGNKATKVIVK